LLKNARCVSCKELGHRIDQCTRDPNLRTSFRIEEEFDRINKIQDFRKLHADTVVNTTHFIKKSVMIPLEIDDDGAVLKPNNVTHPFSRGIMEFDDFNYKPFNEIVFVPEPRG
jgi:hypothetical protein